jgi:formylglycine-generating enzyme required for sulfatase activity
MKRAIVLLAGTLLALSCRPETPPPARPKIEVLQARNGYRLIHVEGGTFAIGSDASEVGHDADEAPRHPVTLTRPYYLGTTEVTVGQFGEFVKATGYRTTAEKEGWAWASDPKQGWAKTKGITWRTPGFPQTPEHPVSCVTMPDAIAFANWLSEREDLDPCYAGGGVAPATGCMGFRLPTEAEWEYAARAGTTTRFACGDDAACLRELAWFRDTSEGHTHPVALKRANRWGFHDMHGNLWEWVHYLGGTFPEDGRPQIDPVGATDPRIQGYRGGSWWSVADYCRSASRDHDGGPGHRNHDLGFRLAKSARG